jgi:hypothetical protein
MNESPKKRILAVDLRSTRVGFAVTETPIRLLDWGNRALAAESCSPLILWLLRRYGVSLLVVRRNHPHSPRNTVRVTNGLRSIRTIARSCSVQLATVSDGDFKRVFQQTERRTKFEIACLMTIIFPELAQFLPRPRRCYEPENRRMSAFDAAALAVAYLAIQPDNDSVRQLLVSAVEVFSAASR